MFTVCFQPKGMMGTFEVVNTKKEMLELVESIKKNFSITNEQIMVFDVEDMIELK